MKKYDAFFQYKAPSQLFFQTDFAKFTAGNFMRQKLAQSTKYGVIDW